jgi:hypothetical protein
MAASLTVSWQEFRVVHYFPTGNELSAEAEETPLLETEIRKLLVETVTTAIMICEVL